MEKYIWLNPVTKNMLHEANIDIARFVDKYGFKLIEVDDIVRKRVKAKYVEYVRDVNDTVIDSRCPLVVDYLVKKHPELKKYIAPIDPIFISTGKYFIEEYLGVDDEYQLVMISPCKALCNSGKNNSNNKIIYMTWVEFCVKFEIELDLKPKKTPVPLGFFDDTELKVGKINGEEEIEDIICKMKEDKYDLIEILFCRDGCHNGDGI